MDDQLDNLALSTEEPQTLRVAQTLANGYIVAAHVVTTPGRCRDFPSLPISDYQAVVNVEPSSTFTRRSENGLTRNDIPLDSSIRYVVVYREISQDKYEMYSKYAQGAEEKDILSDKVERHNASNIEELMKILSMYNLKLCDLHIARMVD